MTRKDKTGCPKVSRNLGNVIYENSVSAVCFDFLFKSNSNENVRYLKFKVTKCWTLFFVILMKLTAF